MISYPFIHIMRFLMDPHADKGKWKKTDIQVRESKGGHKWKFLDIFAPKRNNDTLAAVPRTSWLY